MQPRKHACIFPSAKVQHLKVETKTKRIILLTDQYNIRKEATVALPNDTAIQHVLNVLTDLVIHGMIDFPVWLFKRNIIGQHNLVLAN